MAEIKVTTPGEGRRLILSGGAVAGVIGGIVVSLFQRGRPERLAGWRLRPV